MNYSPRLCQEPLFLKRTKVRSGSRNIIRMNKQTPSHLVLIENIIRLKKQRGWSNRTLAHKAGLSDRMIGKILNSESEPTTASIDKIAGALGVESWMLMVPGLYLNVISGNNFKRIWYAYTSANNEGRELLEAQADYLVKNIK